MNAQRCLALVFLVAFSLGVSPRARAGENVNATFALIIGSNVSVDTELAPLKYADDDAASYFDLFRLLGARTYLLSRLDDNTRRLHPQAAAEALEPRRVSLEQTSVRVAADVAQARDRQVETVLYVVYAGHGNVHDDRGYVTLEDMRIEADDLARLVSSIPATRVHVIVDACASYYLAYSRGPGGERRPLRGFQDSPQLANDPRVGLLLSTSSARESHEWDGIQAGVFSHEVRSGLYGAADADGDGRVSYREIAAFVSRANAAIPNERFRPNVHARAPRQSDTLLDLRRGLNRRLDIDGAHAAHYRIEDARGVWLLDVHNGKDQTVHVVRPSPNGPIYVHRIDDDAEFAVPSSPDVVALADLEGGRPRAAARGAAHEAYNLLFALPFDRGVVQAYTEPSEQIPSPGNSRREVGHAIPVPGLRRTLGWGGIGLGAIGIGVGVAMSISAATEAQGGAARQSQVDVSQRNARISAWNTGAGVGYAAGGLAMATGLVLLLWPDPQHVLVTASSSGAYVGYANAF
jgi:hypothetical protein